MSTVKLPYLKVSQPIGDLYIAKIDAKMLLKLSHSDIRIIESREGNSSGIQRELDKGRVKSIAQFLETVDATIPNNIILNINEQMIVDKGNSVMEVMYSEDTFTVLDGQHRLSGFEYTDTDFELIVTIFIDLTEAQKARIFNKINSTHKPVSKSHSFDLEAESDIEQPRKFVRFIVDTFNKAPNSPWYKMIKMTGKLDQFAQQGIIAQMAFAEPILEYMFPENEFELIRNNIIEGKELPEYNRDKYFLWPYFKGSKQKALYKILDNYYKAVKSTFEHQWGNSNYILCKSVGYKAIMKLFKDLYIRGFNMGDLSQEYFEKALSPSKEFGAKMISTNYSSSSQGANQFYKDLKSYLDLK